MDVTCFELAAGRPPPSPRPRGPEDEPAGEDEPDARDEETSTTGARDDRGSERGDRGDRGEPEKGPPRHEPFREESAFGARIFHEEDR